MVHISSNILYRISTDLSYHFLKESFINYVYRLLGEKEKKRKDIVLEKSLFFFSFFFVLKKNV